VYDNAETTKKRALADKDSAKDARSQYGKVWARAYGAVATLGKRLG